MRRQGAPSGFVSPSGPALASLSSQKSGVRIYKKQIRIIIYFFILVILDEIPIIVEKLGKETRDLKV